MATITLKDLMDPLVKIAAATEKTAQKIDAVVAAVTGGAGSSLNQEIVKELKTQTNLLKVIAGKSGSADTGGEKSSGKSGTLKDAGNTLVALGAGAKELAMGLIIFRFVPKKGVETFIGVIKELFELYDKNKPNKKNVQKTAESINLIGSSIYGLGSSLSKSFLNFTVGYLAARLFLVTINILLPTFDLIGGNKNIKKGAEALDIIGGSLNKFAKGLVLAAIASVVGILFTPVIAAAMILIGGAFALLGLADKNIKKGARATRIMGNALVFFAVGLATAALASIFILMEPRILLAMVGSLILIGGSMALLGLVAGPIKKGAVALTLVGISLAIFSVGYLIFSAVTKNIELKDIGMQALLLVGLGAVTALAGAAIKFIALGALSFIAMGAGLAVFSLGYLPFALVTKDMTFEDIGLQLSLLLGLGLEFAAAGFGAVAIIPGAFAFAAIGGALWALSKGLTAFKSIKFNEDDAEVLTLTLSGIKSAFLGTDASKETGVKGFFSKVGGAITGAVDSVRMLEAAAGFVAAGLSLRVLAKGLTAFKSIKWDDDLSKELVTMLNGVTTAFALAGSSEQVPSTSFFGQMFGFKRTVVEEGISSVMGAGKALTNIVKGLQEFQKMVDSGVDWDRLGDAITKSVGFIQSAFAAVAEEGNVQGGGFFDSLFNIKRNKVAEGISSVKGAGKELTGIANGLKSFQELVDKKIDWNVLGEAVKKSIGFVGTAFADLASDENTRTKNVSIFGLGISWDQNKVDKGIRAVKGAGRELTNIANGLKSFQELVEQKIDWDKLGDAVKKSIGFVGNAFADLASDENTRKKNVSIFGLGISWDQNKVDKGIRAVKGAGEELTNIAKSLQTFSDLDNPAAIADSIKRIFTSIGDTFTLYYEKPKFKSQLDHMKGFVTEISNNAKKGYIHKAAEGMNNIAKAVNSIDKDKAEAFANLFKGAGELTNNQKAFSALVEAVEEIRDALSGQSSAGGGIVEGIKNLFTPNETQMPQVSSELTPVLNNINASLSRLNGTMSSLPAQIQAIEIKVPI